MSLISLTREARRVRKTFGIGLWQQFIEAFHLRYGGTQLDPWEYYFFQVYLPKFDAKEKRSFAGWRRELTIDRLANCGQREVANNKLTFHQLMSENSLPVPVIQAVFGATVDQHDRIPSLTDKEGLQALLLNSSAAFIKPVRGARGKSIFESERTSANKLRITADTGEQIDLPGLTAKIENSAKAGYLIQEHLQTHPSIAAICGNRLTSTRLLIVNGYNGPEIISAVWRCPVGQNMTDNFDAGRKGNLIADINLTSGAIRRIIQGAGWRNIEIDAHPDTGAPLSKLIIPDWQQLTATCLQAAALLNELRLQHWDVAITNHGPVLLEVNVEGGMRTHQIVQQRGIVRAQLAELLEECMRTE